MLFKQLKILFDYTTYFINNYIVRLLITTNVRETISV